MMTREPPMAAQITLETFDAHDFRVVAGIREGDMLDLPELCEPGDEFRLSRGARTHRIAAPAEEPGAAPPPVVTLAEHRLMSSHAQDLRIMVLATREGRRLIWPDRPLDPHLHYTLLASSEGASLRALGSLTAAFAAGTTILRSDGRALPVEALRPGDQVLTRDHGPQELRWIGRHALEAQGDHAPVVIRAGALGNLGDLVVAPRHRIFVFPHDSANNFANLTGTRQGVLIEAHHLVDGDKIHRHAGGRFDFFALVFDAHEVIYAEGLPCESHIVTEASLRRMPAEMAQELKARFPDLAQRPHFATGLG